MLPISFNCICLFVFKPAEAVQSNNLFPEVSFPPSPCLLGPRGHNCETKKKKNISSNKKDVFKRVDENKRYIGEITNENFGEITNTKQLDYSLSISIKR